MDKNDQMRLRELAKKQMEYAKDEENHRILLKWKALGEGRKEQPTVRLLFSNFMDEVVYHRLQCVGQEARGFEAQLLSTMVGRELFEDDTPVPDYFLLGWHTHVSPFGLAANITRQSSTEKSNGYHINAVIENLEESFDLLKGGNFHVDRKESLARRDLAKEIFGDILPIKMGMGSLPGEMTNSLVHLMGMEHYYMAMYDTPEALHRVMNMACNVYERYYDFLEEEKLLFPTVGLSPIAQESYAFNSQLPSEEVSKTEHCWGFLESQETTAVSPEMFGEFVFPYQDRLRRRFGLLSYGCCERVDAIYADYLSKWENLKKLSVSPFNKESQIGEYLRGTDIVYYSKPRADHLAMKGIFDESAIEEYFKTVCLAASGCLFEVAQREVGTLFDQPELGKRYVKVLKRCVETYWKP